jgi:tyrosinase
VSGLGGWGDPNVDFSVPDGGLRTFQLSYPSPHIVRRNFTLLPFNIQAPLMTDRQKIGNSSFSASVIGSILETSAGDFKGFQAVLEAVEVRSCA